MLYITGITGHSGRWFLKRLEAECYDGKIRCVMRQTKEEAPDKYALFEDCNLDLEFAIGDITDPIFLFESLTDVHTIVHTAGIDKSTNLMKAAQERNVHWAILVHTTGRFSKYKSASAGYIKIEDDILEARNNMLQSVSRGKMKTEQVLNCTILRPTMIYGSSSDMNMYRLIGYLSKHLLFPLFGNGSNLMQPVHARDLGNAYYDVLMNPEKTMNKEYDLSGKEEITYIAIIQWIKKYLNSSVKIVRIPMNLSILAAKVYNAIFGKKAILTVEQVLRMQEDKAFSHQAATSDFGYDPLSFEDGIKEEVEEYLSGTRVDYSNIKY